MNKNTCDFLLLFVLPLILVALIVGIWTLVVYSDTEDTNDHPSSHVHTEETSL